jgi:hypothetical protein
MLGREDSLRHLPAFSGVLAVVSTFFVGPLETTPVERELLDQISVVAVIHGTAN